MDRVAQVAIEALALVTAQYPADDVEHREFKESITAVTEHLNRFVAEMNNIEHDSVALWHKKEKITTPCDCGKCDLETTERRLFAVREALLDTLAEGEAAEASPASPEPAGVSAPAARTLTPVEEPVEKFV